MRQNKLGHYGANIEIFNLYLCLYTIYAWL